MNHPPVSHDVRALARRIHERTGWELPESRLRELSRAAAGVGEVSDRKLETIIETLCVGETYFFRDRALYHALATAILPEVIVAHAGGARAISIWSAGCATGEEPYSLATILRGCQGAAEPGGQPVLATDLSATFLARAREGVYGKNSFRTVTAEMRRKHLLEHGPGRWRVMPEVKAMVRFARLNLVRDLFPTGVDLLVCQNVLMYFTRACARQVIEGFARSLRPGGWLVTSASETMLVDAAGLSTVRVNGRTFHRRDTSPAPRTGAVLPPARGKAIVTTSAANPPAAKDLARQARTFANAGEIAAAAASCARAIVVDGMDARLHYLMATIEETRGNGTAALDSLHRALYLDPDFAMAQFAAGVIARSLGRGSAASVHLGAALSIATRMDPAAEVAEGDGLDAGGLARMVAMTLKGRM